MCSGLVGRLCVIIMVIAVYRDMRFATFLASLSKPLFRYAMLCFSVYINVDWTIIFEASIGAGTFRPII